jgi:2-polyprenyl-3-methyl-5-hydroxy-6-metoxy-1,4-benzoquinol methylase
MHFEPFIVSLSTTYSNKMVDKEFQFKEIDSEGINTLSVLANADKLNAWFYKTIKPYCKGKVLEIGSGIGNISQYFINDNFDISLSDLRNNYLEILTNRFSKFNPNKFQSLDLVDPDFDKKHQDKFDSFDTIFALNVVEHIKDDQQAIINCYKLLKKGGSLIILVPAYQSLYNRFDKELEHYKRYNKKSLSNLFTQATFTIIHKQYFNAAGILGWIISGSILNNKLLPEGHVSLYNKFVPLFKITDKILLNKVGLSVITVGVK